MNFVPYLLNKAEFPEASHRLLCELASKVEGDARCMELAKKLVPKDYSDVTAEIITPLKEIGTEYGAHEYSFAMAFYLVASELLLDKYRADGIAEENFWSFVDDFRCKLNECYENYGVWGTSSIAWHAPFYYGFRYALGRFQYDDATFMVNSYTKRGITIKKGDPCVRFHIPSSGPLTRELRHDSYRRAYEFYRERFNGIVPITCSSWLLYPMHAEFLAPNSNLIDFIHDFDFVCCNAENPEFLNKWRVFSRAYDDKPHSELPERTSMQRSYKRRLLEGGMTGGGFGALFYDENGIIR